MNPESLTESILSLARELQYPETTLEPLQTAAQALPSALPLEKLADPTEAEKAWETICASLPAWQEDSGMAQLAVTTAAAQYTRAAYQKLGIPEEVFLSTMLCIPRFLKETQALYGRPAYDRAFWTWRQTGCLLFRLGTLEFEYTHLTAEDPIPQGLQPGDPVLSVHIPSDAKLVREEIQNSFSQAAEFFNHKTAGPWRGCPPKAVVCITWLLAKPLEDILPPTSGIRVFCSFFQRYAEIPGEESYFQWVYQLPEPAAYETLPENTSLQRKLKAFLLSGGQLGEGAGILK